MQKDVQRLTLHHHHYLVEMNFLMEMKVIQVEMKKMEVGDKNHLYHYLAGAAVNYVRKITGI